MGRLYTSLPLDNPARQFYQNVIDNSRKRLASQMVSDQGKVNDTTSFDKAYEKSKSEARDNQPLAAQVKDGKIVDTWSNKNSSESYGSSKYNRRSDQQQALQDLYEMMRGGFFGNGSFGLL